MSMSYSLPLELILLVISNVAKDKDKDSLKKLSLTSTALRGPCQRFLFSDLLVAPEGPGLRASDQSRKLPGERLLGLLSSSPDIASYVKKITLSELNWMRTDEKLSEALHKLDLKKIEGLAVRLAGGWRHFPPSTRGVITEICQSPALLELTLWLAPMELLQFCGPSLKRLTATGHARPADMGVARWPRESNLEYLRICPAFFTSSVAAYLLDSTRIRLTRLRTLHVTFLFTSELTWLFALIHLFRNSLKSIVMEVSTDIHNIRPGALLIAECPNLTELNLKVVVGIYRSHLPSAVELVCIIPPSNRLQKFCLDVRFEDNGETFSGIPIWTNEDSSRALRVLGIAVNNSALFPRLEAFDVDILVPGSAAAEAISTIREWALNALSIPSERVMFHLRVSFRR